MRLSIPNHYTPRLSELDLRMVRAVPPGGNWKNIPVSIPSRRLEQIRESFKAGKGSRSTYYGRLDPDRPAYTVNTYFNRPGNGCHIHFDFGGGQHRVLSQREAARLQSFPDSFVFYGSRGAVNKQIGNAVPPLLAYQVAAQLGSRGEYLDLFCGAGGLSLGFRWAGWTSLGANDHDANALTTYGANIDPNVILGDLRDPTVLDQVVGLGRNARRQTTPFWVLGGPPCQGFSTAGNRRSMDDERNSLFRQYREILERLRPDGFVFENVPGLLSMEDGAVLNMIRVELEAAGFETTLWQLQAENYCVPQRRTRIFLIGRAQHQSVTPPEPVTRLGEPSLLTAHLPKVFSVREALGDLPPLEPGEDGAEKDYASEPVGLYQQFMRGLITVQTLVNQLRRGGI